MVSISWTAARGPRLHSVRRFRRPADWTTGLATHTANALRAFGLCSRAKVEALPLRRLKCISNLGRSSLLDLQAWLYGPLGLSC